MQLSLRRGAHLLALPLALPLALSAACGGDVAVQVDLDDSDVDMTGGLILKATDAPLPLDQVESAVFTFDEIRIHSDEVDDGSGEDGWLTLYEGSPRDISLTELRNGVTDTLVDAELTTGVYDQVRLTLVRAELVLVNGNTYTTESGTLHGPSLMNSGLKLHLEPPLEIVGGITSELLVDFDLSKTFKPVPGNAGIDADRFNLHPGVRVVLLSEAGEIRGLALHDEAGVLVPVVNAGIYLMPPGETDVGQAIASTVSEEEGEFAFLGVEPGLFDVLARTQDLEGRTNSVEVFATSVTEVEVVLE